MLLIKGLSARIGDFSLKDICLTVASGAYFVLLGPSGAGKSILIETICGLKRSDRGTIELNGRDLGSMLLCSRRIGFVSQSIDLFPHLSVFENIAFALRCRRVDARQCTVTVNQLADRTGAGSLLNRMPATLSGGEAQRVSLARALAAEPELLILDEPTAALDHDACVMLRSLLRKLHSEGQTVLHVTHDYDEAIALATDIAVIEQGAIVQQGVPADVLSTPQCRFVAGFTGEKNFFQGCFAKSPEGFLMFECGTLRLRLENGPVAGSGCIIIPQNCVQIGDIDSSPVGVNTFDTVIEDGEMTRHGWSIRINIGVWIVVLPQGASKNQHLFSIGRKIRCTIPSESIRVIMEKSC